MRTHINVGDRVRARPVGIPERSVTGTVVGASNASGRLTIAVEATSGDILWCETATAVVLQASVLAPPTDDATEPPR